MKTTAFLVETVGLVLSVGISVQSLGCAANVTHPIPALDTKGDVYKTEGPNDPLIYDPVVGDKTAVLLYVDFPNIPQAGDTKERGQKLLAGGKFQKLFKDQSYGKLSLDIKHVHGWRTMPKKNKAYDPTTTEGHRKMFVDAFALYPEINMLDYDYILISMPGRGNFAFGERDDKAIPYRGKKINTAVNQGSMSYFTLAHELAHCMGLPDLYSYGDAKGPRNPLGPWDIMSGPATGFLGWHRHKFGWLRMARRRPQNVSLKRFAQTQARADQWRPRRVDDRRAGGQPRAPQQGLRRRTRPAPACERCRPAQIRRRADLQCRRHARKRPELRRRPPRPR